MRPGPSLHRGCRGIGMWAIFSVRQACNSSRKIRFYRASREVDEFTRWVLHAGPCDCEARADRARPVSGCVHPLNCFDNSKALRNVPGGNPFMKHGAWSAFVCMLVAAAASAQSPGQAYPVKPVRIII